MSLSSDFKFLVEQHYKEVNNYWIRNNVFLIVFIAIFGGLISNFSSDKPLPTIFVGTISIVGIIFCYLWIKVNRISEYYFDRWFMDAKRLIKDDDNSKEIVSCSLGFYEIKEQGFYVKRPKSKRASYYIKAMIYLIIITWFVIISYSIFA